MSKWSWLVCVVVVIAACKQSAPTEAAAGSGSAPAPKPAVSAVATPVDAEALGPPVTTPDGLTTVRPLSDFTCARDEGNTVLCDYQGDRGMSLGFTSIADPISTKVDVLASKMEGGVAKALPSYVRISQAEGTCAPGVSGIETWASYTMKGFHLRRRSCVFVKNGHGHSVSYSMPMDDLPVLEQRAHALIGVAEFQ